jgi:cytoskeletal protein CcmA (bactofilin family)
MRSLRSVAAAMGVVGSLALPSAALAAGPQSLNCTGVVSGGTYSSLNVPPGQACFLSNATVLGNATVQSTGSLELDNNGRIGGNVVANSLASFDVNDNWTVNGTIFGNSAAELIIAATTHNILANNDDTLAIQSATVKGNIVSNNGVFGGAIASSAIYGNVLVNGTSPGEDGVTSTWVIAGPQLNGDQQEIYGNLVLTDNQSEMLVFYNHIHENFACYGNNPPPFTDLGTGLENTVDGRSLGQCATPNAPSPGAAASARSAIKAAGVPAP